MKKIIVFFIALISLLLSYKNYNIEKDKEKHSDIKKEIYQNKTNENNSVKNVSIKYKDKIVDLELEDYVVGVVSCEMPASFNIEALKAMAVAARTFALYKLNTNKNYKLSTTTKDQCYITKERMKKNWGNNFDRNYKKILKAVSDTTNEYMTYKNKIIISFYFSISNGYTENCENVFSQKLDYLKSVDSSWDKEYSYKTKTVKFKVKDFFNKLNIKSNKINNIKISRSKTGRINKIIINNKEFKGTKFRSLLGLRSTDVDIKEEKNYIYITTRGYGHGVGMSQYGANAMAKKGYKYDEILKYYYKGIKIHE